MFKSSIELFKVHKSFKVKYSLIVEEDKSSKFPNMINKFSMLGNEYLKIIPHPFITIDIQSRADKNEGWNSNLSFNMNRKELYFISIRLKKIYNAFQVKDLFYSTNGKLEVNKERAYELREVFVCGGKTIWIQACVVENDEDHMSYEGVFMSINTIDNFTYLTYSELGYLAYELSKIDIDSLTLQMINTVYLMKEMESKEIIKKQPVVEIPDNEIIDVKPRVIIEEPNTIPDI